MEACLGIWIVSFKLRLPGGVQGPRIQGLLICLRFYVEPAVVSNVIASSRSLCAAIILLGPHFLQHRGAIIGLGLHTISTTTARKSCCCCCCSREGGSSGLNARAMALHQSGKQGNSHLGAEQAELGAAWANGRALLRPCSLLLRGSLRRRRQQQAMACLPACLPAFLPVCLPAAAVGKSVG